MGDVVSFPLLLDSDLGRQLVVDLARYRENLLDEKSIRKKYRLADDVWEKLGDDDELIRKVEEESVRRIRDGSAKREKSQKLVVQAPDVLSGILLDSSANAKHRIDSAKLLNDFSANGPAGVPAADKFQISIVIGDQVLNFDKSIKPDADPNHIDDAPQDEWLPMIATSKKDGGDGEPI